MTRVMGDAEHKNVPALKTAFPRLPLVALYVTGSPDVRSVPADFKLWPDATPVTIDQGFTGSPVMTAVVRDVEPRCWSAKDAVNLDGWTAERPTIYCDRYDLEAVIAEGWRGDVWLAWPGYAALAAPLYSGVKVVAVQRTTTDNYDLSTVFDDTWPFERIQEKAMINKQIPAAQKAHVPFPVGTFASVHVYRDFLSQHHSTEVRVAFHSQTAGYHIITVTLDSATPEVIVFPHPDIDAVSIENDSPIFEIGVTFA